MNKVLFSHSSDEWSTPLELFNRLNDLYFFTLDPCSTDSNCLCDKHFTISDDGLSKDWSFNSVFCNPPYSQISKWVQKAVSSEFCDTVLLLPARTDTKWFHDLIYGKYPIEFLRGRLKFGNSKNSAPFPSMLVYVFNLTKCKFGNAVIPY